MGDLAYKYNDAELRQLQTDMRLMAEILIEYYYLRLEGEREDSLKESNP
ncbi:MAG: hypothetical protein AAB738_02000 [Patescibacteria group bacterium]